MKLPSNGSGLGVSSGCGTYPISERMTSGLSSKQILLFSVSAEPLSALFSSIPMRDSRKVRRGHGLRTGMEIWPKARFNLDNNQKGWLVLLHGPQILPTSNRTSLCFKKLTLQVPAEPNKSLKLIQVLYPQGTNHFFSYSFVLIVNHPTVMSKRRANCPTHEAVSL